MNQHAFVCALLKMSFLDKRITQEKDCFVGVWKGQCHPLCYLLVYSILTVGSRGTLLFTVLLLPGLISSPLSPPTSPPLPPSTNLSSLTKGPEGGVAARPTSRVSKNSKLVLASGSSPSRLSSFFFCLCFKYLIETDLMRFLMELYGVAGWTTGWSLAGDPGERWSGGEEGKRRRSPFLLLTQNWLASPAIDGVNREKVEPRSYWSSRRGGPGEEQPRWRPWTGNGLTALVCSLLQGIIWSDSIGYREHFESKMVIEPKKNHDCLSF